MKYLLSIFVSLTFVLLTSANPSIANDSPIEIEENTEIETKGLVTKYRWWVGGLCVIKGGSCKVQWEEVAR
ncbi:MAG: hypothetical protein LAT68_00640 [Cyclobacteriaceae bacterium]|nr:hypothetical protein [Cyclobacteriaceae bacterium]MCH8514810.1 hypothetical protein [Cyclobacteriaceae bacterium]